MFRNYLKITWRNLLKSKVFSAINILGLTIGITCCMMIFLYIMNEFSVDRFHKNGQHVFRVLRGFDEGIPPTPYMSAIYLPALLNDFGDDIQAGVRVMKTTGMMSYNNQVAFNENKLYYADSNFFQLFSFPLIKGDPATALKYPNSVVLTASTAKKYFGSEDPMGKVITVNKEMQLKVTGIAKDVPATSTLDFEVVAPISNFYQADFFKQWLDHNLFIYLQLRDPASQAKLEKQFPQFMEKYVRPDMDRLGADFTLSLRPLKDVYFEDASTFDWVRHGDRKVVYIFLSIAILILLIACINFINLSTIRAVERSKEVGIRKVMGALRNQLVVQFIGESVLLTLVATFISIALLQMLMPWYNQLVGYTLEVSWTSPSIYLFLLGIVVVVGLLAGSYPAFFLSGFAPIAALKGKLRLGKGGSFFRQTLVVVQFSISVLLIIGTIVIMKQMNYVRTKNLGYDREQTVVIRIDNDEFFDHRLTFKKELQSRSAIANVSLMSGEPGGFFDSYNFEVEGQPEEGWKSRTEFADFEVVSTLGLKIIAGRNFSPQFGTDSAEAVLINQTAATKLGFTPEQAIGKWIRNKLRDPQRRRVVGVVEDFNFLSLKENMDALVISPGEDARVALVKIKPGQIPAGLAAIKEVYSQVAPVYPLEYTFLDEKFGILYQKDLRQQSILTIFSGLAIFVACLGLFGLASYTAAKRVKEIGVRKVLGASVQNIVVLLSKDALKPVLLAALIAIPAGYWAMENWLQRFAYRTSLHWWVFLIAAGITLAIALLTIGFKAIRAAMANPAKSLKSE